MRFGVILFKVYEWWRFCPKGPRFRLGFWSVFFLFDCFIVLRIIFIILLCTFHLLLSNWSPLLTFGLILINSNSLSLHFIFVIFLYSSCVFWLSLEKLERVIFGRSYLSISFQFFIHSHFHLNPLISSLLSSIAGGHNEHSFLFSHPFYLISYHHLVVIGWSFSSYLSRMWYHDWKKLSIG